MVPRSVLVIALVVSSLGMVPAGQQQQPPQLQLGRSAPAVFADHRILVIGGTSIEGALRSVESWDPTEGRPFFRHAGALAVARRGHTATVLPDDSVLVVGGGGRGARARAAELRKPESTWEARDSETQGWRLSGSLADNRTHHTASLLPDGRVLVVGGIGENDRELASAEIWSPRSGTWRSTGRLHVARWDHSAVTLEDGRVLVVGGSRTSRETGAEALDSAEVWDPKTGSWSMTGALPDPAHELTVSLLPDGRVLAAGGVSDGGNPEPGNPIWDPKDGQWSKAGGDSLGRRFHTTSVLADGRIVAVGGAALGCGNHGCSWSETANVEIWNPSKHVWTPAGELGVARLFHSTVVLPDGRLVVIGGTWSWHRSDEYISNVEVVTPP